MIATYLAQKPPFRPLKEIRYINQAQFSELSQFSYSVLLCGSTVAYSTMGERDPSDVTSKGRGVDWNFS